MRYIVDVTQLVHRPGNMTGIPRVMNELSVRFLKYSTENTVFISWVKEIGEMCEINFVTSMKHRGSGIDYIHRDANVPATASTNTHSMDTRVFTKKVVKKLAVKSRFDRTGLYKRAVGMRHQHELANYKVYKPEDGDKLFIPWGEWWDQNWLNKIADYHKQGAQLYPICHDIVPIIVPQFSGNSASIADFIRQIFPISTVVLTPSRATSQDLKGWMQQQQLPIPPLEVFRLGEDFTVTKSSITDTLMMRDYDVEKDAYLLSVGTIEPRKNRTLLYYTYKLAVSRGIELPKLLIVGRTGHDSDEIVKFIREDPETKNLLRIYSDVNDDELVWLYEHCLFTVQPSFYEGWGMPVIESIAKGKPAICSSTSSLLEMPDNCVLRFDPASTDECLATMQEMLRPSTLKQYTESTRKYHLHSWDASYKQVIAALEAH